MLLKDLLTYLHWNGHKRPYTIVGSSLRTSHMQSTLQERKHG